MTTPKNDTPGRETPGLQTPQFTTPGHVTPGGAYVPAASATGVAVDATGTTTLGPADGDRDVAYVVTVNASAADFDFNVNVGTETLFDSAQTPSGTTEEVFIPDVEAITDAAEHDIVFEVTSASATGGATADVSVEAVSEDQS